MDFENAQDKPTPKRRGRPPKKAVSQVVLRSPSPVEKPVAPKMLSLKEKLAPEGKSVKIVSKPAKTIENGSGPSSARNTPSTTPRSATIPKSILKQPSIVIPMASEAAISKPAPTLSSSENSPVTNPADLSSSRPTSVSTARPVLPPKPSQHTGPTVVRLMSPDSESEEDARLPSNPSGSDDSSSDDDEIPAVISPKAVRGTMAVRGRGRPRGRPPGVRLH